MPLDGIQEDAEQLDLATYSQKIREIFDEIEQKTVLLKLGYRNMEVYLIILFISMCFIGEEMF